MVAFNVKRILVTEMTRNTRIRLFFWGLVRHGLRAIGALPAARKIRDQWYFGRNDNNRTLILIHVGKCGGLSLRNALTESPRLSRDYDKILVAHLREPPVCQNAHYMIVIRNPIKRAISAFNYTYRRVVEKGVRRSESPEEYEILKKYKTLNSLAEQLYVRGYLQHEVAADFEKIRHLHERISFYLRNFLAHVKPEQIQFVLAQETLDRDIEYILGVNNRHKIHCPGAIVEIDKTFLSDEGYFNLKRYMADDYIALKQLLSICNTSHVDSDVLLK